MGLQQAGLLQRQQVLGAQLLAGLELLEDRLGGGLAARLLRLAGAAGLGVGALVLEEVDVVDDLDVGLVDLVGLHLGDDELLLQLVRLLAQLVGRLVELDHGVVLGLRLLGHLADLGVRLLGLLLELVGRLQGGLELGVGAQLRLLLPDELADLLEALHERLLLGDREDRGHVLVLQHAGLLLQLGNGLAGAAVGHALAPHSVGGLLRLVGGAVGLVAQLLGALDALVELVAALLVLVGLVDEGAHLGVEGVALLGVLARLVVEAVALLAQEVGLRLQLLLALGGLG